MLKSTQLAKTSCCYNSKKLALSHSAWWLNLPENNHKVCMTVEYSTTCFPVLWADGSIDQINRSLLLVINKASLKKRMEEMQIFHIVRQKRVWCKQCKLRQNNCCSVMSSPPTHTQLISTACVLVLTIVIVNPLTLFSLYFICLHFYFNVFLSPFLLSPVIGNSSERSQ